MADPMAASRTTVRRVPQRGSSDRALLDSILDEGLVCHVGMVEGSSPVVIPTGYVRDGDRLLLHGSTASRLMQYLASGKEACITVTLLDGLVLARSAFHHSMNYRSAVVFGKGRRIPASEANEMLFTYMERIMPGRWDAVRQPNAKELAGTMVVEVPIIEFSCKVREGPPKDDTEDVALEHWSGVIPMATVTDLPQQDPTQAKAATPQMVLDWRPERR